MISFQEYIQTIDESGGGITRVLSHKDEGRTMVFISACRGCYTLSENKKRTQKMRDEITKLDFGFIKSYGGYIEIKRKVDSEKTKQITELFKDLTYIAPDSDLDQTFGLYRRNEKSNAVIDKDSYFTTSDNNFFSITGININTEELSKIKFNTIEKQEIKDELSCIVIGNTTNKNTPKERKDEEKRLIDAMFKLGHDYDQDSILVLHYDGTAQYYYTNDRVDYEGNDRKTGDKGKLMKNLDMNQAKLMYYTNLHNKKFAFK